MNRNDISFSLDQPKNQRNGYRALVHGLQARILESDEMYEIHDISNGGCRLGALQRAYAAGRILRLHLEIKGKVILADLQARVVRCTPDAVMACRFHELTRTQEYALDKLVLEIQKRQIVMRREHARTETDASLPPEEPQS